MNYLANILEILLQFSWPIQVLFLIVSMFSMHFLSDTIIRVSEHISNVRINKHRILAAKKELELADLDDNK